MKIVTLIGLLVGALFVTTGCGTPGYSAAERNQIIARDWGYDFAQASDDLDHFMLFRPASHMTIWNVQ